MQRRIIDIWTGLVRRLEPPEQEEQQALLQEHQEAEQTEAEILEEYHRLQWT